MGDEFGEGGQRKWPDARLLPALVCLGGPTRLVDASIRVYGATLAEHVARMAVGGAAAAGSAAALAVPGEGIRLPGRGRALGWAPPGPHELGRGDAIMLTTNPWMRPIAGTASTSPQRARAGEGGGGAPPQLTVLPVGTGAVAASVRGAARGGGGGGGGAPPAPRADGREPHLPSPKAQARPVGLPPSAPLGGLAPPGPAAVAAAAAAGSVRFGAPVLPAASLPPSTGLAAAAAALAPPPSRTPPPLAPLPAPPVGPEQPLPGASLANGSAATTAARPTLAPLRADTKPLFERGSTPPDAAALPVPAGSARAVLEPLTVGA
jgi:hypothetical protein